MNYFMLLWSIAVFVENRLSGSIDYSDLEWKTGYSLAHIRYVFKNQTGRSLSAYILERRIANAAFDLVHTKLTVLEIAYKYHFSSHDSFTRAFHRLTGFTPSAFRANQIKTGRVKLCAGIYGVGIIKREDESK